MVTSNQDSSLKIDIGDGRIVCFDVSARCRGNGTYFKKLLITTCTGSGYEISSKPWFISLGSEDIPSTKMKTETIRDQPSNSIPFIIDYISSWSEDWVEKSSCVMLYQDYRTSYEANTEKAFTSNILGKKFSRIDIERKQVRVNGKRESWPLQDHG